MLVTDICSDLGFTWSFLFPARLTLEQFLGFQSEELVQAQSIDIAMDAEDEEAKVQEKEKLRSTVSIPELKRIQALISGVFKGNRVAEGIQKAFNDVFLFGGTLLSPI